MTRNKPLSVWLKPGDKALLSKYQLDRRVNRSQAITNLIRMGCGQQTLEQEECERAIQAYRERVVELETQLAEAILEKHKTAVINLGKD